MGLVNRLKAVLYVRVLFRLIDTGYQLLSAHVTGIIPFSVNSWQPVTVTVKTSYIDYDYLLLKDRVAARMLTWLHPTVDNSELKPFSAWATQQELAVGSHIPVESETDVDLEDFFWNKTGSFFLELYSDRQHQHGDNDVVGDTNNVIDNDSTADAAASWCVDFSYMEQYEVKDNCYRYGGKLDFNNQGCIVGASYLGTHYTTIPDWLELVIRATVSLVSIVEVHLCRIHIATAQRRTLEWRNNIKPDDKLVPLLQVITFNTLSVNRSIPVLLPLLRNTTGLTQAALDQYINNSVAKGSLDNQQIYGLSSSTTTPNQTTAWNSKMVGYSQVVRQLLDSLYPDADIDTNISVSPTSEQLPFADSKKQRPFADSEQQLTIHQSISKQQLLDYILVASAGHNQFGDAMIANLVVRGTFPPLVRLDSYEKMSYLEAMNLQTIAYVVSARLPLFSADVWYQHFPDSAKPACAAFQAWSAARASGWFQPANFEISVGV